MGNLDNQERAVKYCIAISAKLDFLCIAIKNNKNYYKKKRKKALKWLKLNPESIISYELITLGREYRLKFSKGRFMYCYIFTPNEWLDFKDKKDFEDIVYNPSIGIKIINFVNQIKEI